MEKNRPLGKSMSDNQVRRELLEEEIAKLEFFLNRHRRWKIQSDDPEIARQHRVIADTLTDTLELCNQLIEHLKSELEK